MEQQREVRFGGTPIIPAPEVFRNAAAKNPPWYRILERAYAEFATNPDNVGTYADPRGDGATLEQVYRVFTVFGVEPRCILVRDLPATVTSGIPSLVRQAPKDLIGTLKKLDALSGRLNVPTLHYDGQTGHNIRLTRYQPRTDRFVYHDPWPLDSLLCAANNLAGVQARKEGNRWTVTASELERVIFASFILPDDLACLESNEQPVKRDRYLDEWQQSEFYRFFHLIETRHRSESGLERRIVAPHNFKSQVWLQVDNDSSGRIFKASLVLEQGWHRSNVPLALDIAKSFVLSFGPAAELEEYAALAARLWSLRDPKVGRQIVDEGAASEMNLLLLCFLGAPVEAHMAKRWSTLRARNVAIENERYFEMEFDLT